jgi:hypothetical protein
MGLRLFAAVRSATSDSAQIQPKHGKKQSATGGQNPVCMPVRWRMKCLGSCGPDTERDRLHKTKSDMITAR